LRTRLKDRTSSWNEFNIVNFEFSESLQRCHRSESNR
jgi:hypothetical protein